MKTITISASICFLLVGQLRAEDSAISLHLRLGRFAPRITSALWDENSFTFTASASDFNALTVGVEAGTSLAEIVDLVIGVETSSRTVFSMYRDFVRDDGTEIVQNLSLRMTPLTVGLRLLPAGREHRVQPYVGGGGAFYSYEYTEEGEFVELDTSDIFVDLFVDRGVAYGGYVCAGAELVLSESIAAFGEYRRHWTQGEHGGDFEGYGRFDLTANQVIFGVGTRF
jgi:hypothetical protein